MYTNVSQTERRQWKDDDDAVPPFQSRELICEYLLKTSKPLHQQQQYVNRRHSTAAVDMSLAYKHPLVVSEELRYGIPQYKYDSNSMMSNNNVYVSEENEDEDEEEEEAIDESIIIPQEKQHMNEDHHHHQQQHPHLIGRVTESIAKTWEQLTNGMHNNNKYESNNNSESNEDKQSYVLFVRRPLSFQKSEDFSVKKIKHESGSFFDSIENDDDNDDEEEEIDNELAATEAEAGEMMAEELDSLEMRCNDAVLWSIES